MDIVKVEMSFDFYQRLSQADRSQMVVINSEPKDFDYSFDERWKQLKYESVKAYKALKDREFELRNA